MTSMSNQRAKSPRNKTDPLRFCLENDEVIEIGIDEAGKGPMFGPVYTAAVVLPKDDELFDHSQMKDSKRFHSKKKIAEVADYIKANAIAWSVTFQNEKTIDDINIRQATLSSMHNAVNNIITSKKLKPDDIRLLVDGNDFKPMMRLNSKNVLTQINHICIEGGDNKFTAIAAASILAKVERDKYIEELCAVHPYLDEQYEISKNKGYGTKNHLNGIKLNGISPWHRRTYGICRDYC